MARPGGNPTFLQERNEDTRRATAKGIELADAYARETGKKLAKAGQRFTTYADYANWLNQEGWVTRRGMLWTPMAVSRLLARLGVKLPRRPRKKK